MDYLYKFIIGDFDMNEQTFTHISKKELSDEEIQGYISNTLKVNKHAAYCNLKDKYTRGNETNEKGELKWSCDSCDHVWHDSFFTTYIHCPKCGSEDMGHH